MSPEILLTIILKLFILNEYINNVLSIEFGFYRQDPFTHDWIDTDNYTDLKITAIQMFILRVSIGFSYDFFLNL